MLKVKGLTPFLTLMLNIVFQISRIIDYKETIINVKRLDSFFRNPLPYSLAYVR